METLTAQGRGGGNPWDSEEHEAKTGSNTQAPKQRGQQLASVRASQSLVYFLWRKCWASPESGYQPSKPERSADAENPHLTGIPKM